MGRPSLPETALLFAAVLYAGEEHLSEARGRLTASFGDVLMESEPLPWDYSDYYDEEFGRPLKRVFLFFRERIDTSNLSEIKLLTNAIEGELSSGNRRSVNIDPGYQTLAKVVLASTKNYSHRISVGKGIYAEVTLIYRNDGYQPHLFTYRDYASESVRKVFRTSREFLKSR